jgi:hypothetical protein
VRQDLLVSRACKGFASNLMAAKLQIHSHERSAREMISMF